MSKAFAAVQPHDPRLTRRARRRPEGLQSAGAPDPLEPTQRSSSDVLDPEMLDLVEKFEQGYAEFAPASDETLKRDTRSDDLFPEFPDVFADLPGERPADKPSIAAQRREPLWSPDTIPAPRREKRAAAEPEDEIDLDEAFSILRAPQMKRADAEERQSRSAEAHAQMRSDGGDRARHDHETEPASAPAAAVERSQIAWTTKSHRPHTIAIGAAVFALIVGVGVGYVAGHAPGHAKSAAPTEAAHQGGARLRLDYNFEKL